MACSREQYLSRRDGQDGVFRLDLHLTREAVASGVMTVTEGVQYMDDCEKAGKELSPAVRRELRGCLSTIATGKCLEYQKISTHNT